MEKAITKAIEGGYDEYAHAGDPTYNAILLDPLFWQCLGKAVGWKEDDPLYDRFKRSSKINRTWLYHWHRFIDHLAEGKDAESFFNELLNHNGK